MVTTRKAVDVERVRVAAERDAKIRLRNDGLQRQGDAAPQDVAAVRRALLGDALLLTETMAPAAHAAAREAMAVLGVEDEIELFQSSGCGTDTARLVLYGNPIGVEFLGGYLGSLDHGGLLAVLGHEIGHAIAHHGKSSELWASQACASGSTPNRRAYAMATELTADRFGLLACRDLDAVLRLEMQSAVGRSASGIRLDVHAYLEQCRDISEALLARGGTALGSTHPEHYVRGYAEWLFSETDVYASSTGSGAGSRSIEDVETIVRRLVGLRPEPARLAPVGRSTVRAPVDLRVRFEEHVRRSDAAGRRR